MAKGETRSFSEGVRGQNRVRVYERWRGGPLQIEWTTAARKRKQKTLTNLARMPLYWDTDEALARKIARQMSERLRTERLADTEHALFGVPTPKTLSQLLTELHETRGPDWRPKYRQQQESMRDWWLDKLGKSARLTDVADPGRLLKIVRAEAKAKGWSRRTQAKYLRYLKDAFGFAWREKKWIREDHNLSDLKLPKAAKGGPAYSREEMRKLLAEAPKRDLRVWAALEIAYGTVSRIDAVRMLRVSDYRTEIVDGETWGVLHFPIETDKAHAAGDAYLPEPARRVVELLVQQPAVRATGWLFPSGELSDPTRKGRVRVSAAWLTDELHDLERAAEVEVVKKRAWHAVKRRASTDAATAAGIGAASKQGRTTREMLERVYEQHDPGPKIAAARGLALLRGA